MTGIPRFIARILELGEPPAAQERGAGWEALDPLGMRERTARTPVSPRTVSGIPAVELATRIASEAVAQLPMRVWRGEGPGRERVSGTWQARLLAGAPNPEQPRFEFWETIERSLTTRNNAYVWKTQAAGRVLELWALHPDQVAPALERNERRYRVHMGGEFLDPLGAGPQGVIVGPDTVLQIRGAGGGGLLAAPTPIQRHRAALGAAISKQRHEEALYGRMARLPLALSFPESTSAEQARGYRELWQASYEGPEASGKTPVIGGGAKIERIGLSQSDAQFVEAMNLSVEEVARILNVQASLLGVARSDRPLSPEHEQDRWLRYGLGGRLARIESALEADPSLFGPGARTRPGFDSGAGVRGDLLTEETMAHQQVQDGRLLVDEWRSLRGLPPLPGGAGMVPQIVPVGAGANPAPVTPADPGEDEED